MAGDMKIYTTYGVKIKHYNHIFKDTVKIYRNAVDFLIDAVMQEWDVIHSLKGKQRVNYMEHLVNATKEHPIVKYDFDAKFYKFPSYLRQGAISEAIGNVSSYKNNLANWEKNPTGKEPGYPKAGYVYPALYRDNMYKQTDAYTAQVKVWIRNTWDCLVMKVFTQIDLYS